MSTLRVNNLNISNKLKNLGSLTTNTSLDFSFYNTFSFIVNSNISLSFANNNKEYNKITLIINPNSYKITWPTNITWLNNVSSLRVNTTNILYLITTDNGVTWYGDTSSNGIENTEIPINITLSASLWDSSNQANTGYHLYTYNNDYITENSKITITPNMDYITSDQLSMYQVSNMYIGVISDGSVQIRAYDTKPIIDIPVILTIEDSNVEILTSVSWDHITGKNVSVTSAANYLPQGNSSGKIDNSWLNATISSNTTGNAATATSITGPLNSIISSSSIMTSEPTVSNLVEGQIVFVVEE